MIEHRRPTNQVQATDHRHVENREEGWSVYAAEAAALSHFYKALSVTCCYLSNNPLANQMDSALLKALETTLFHNTISHYTVVSSLCLYVYDYHKLSQIRSNYLGGLFLMLPEEVAYFWNSPWTLVKVLFFWIRYFTLLGMGYLTFAEVNRHPTIPLCVSHGILGLFISIPSNTMAQGESIHVQGFYPIPSVIRRATVIMQLRVHVIYGHDVRLKIVLSFLNVLGLASKLGIAISQLVKIHSSVQPIPGLRDPLAFCVGTIPKLFLFYPVPMMVFDSILLLLVLYKAFLFHREEPSTKAHWNGHRLVRIMFRDSVMYFLCAVGANLLNLLIWFLAPFDLFTVGTAWGISATVMAASRILFNMRKAYHEPPGEDEGWDGAVTMSDLQVAPRVDEHRIWPSFSPDRTLGMAARFSSSPPATSKEPTHNTHPRRTSTGGPQEPKSPSAPSTLNSQ
ncbi:hypothetical protein C8R43DRAFT_1230202 [Mycena crocata]|nr:hypothetical protein C8R43DRAFT_1230202 [Mycena crocata]